MKTNKNELKNNENTTEYNTNFFKEKSISLENENSALKEENEILEAKVKYYEEQLRLNASKKYGSSSEKINPEQISIFNEAEKLSQKESKEPVAEEIITKRKAARSKKRRTYDDLEVEKIYYNLSEEEKICPKCSNILHEMKTEIRKEFKIIPAQVKIVHHLKQVYACRHCDNEGISGTIITAKMPNPILKGSMVSPSLLAFIINNKYSKALPLYRQEKEFINFGIDISRQNMAKWIVSSSNDHLKIFYDRLHEELLKEDIVHADETTLQVIDEKDNKKNYMWLYASANLGKKQIYLYDYKASRANKHPKTFLKGFKGYLQSDGYAGYNSVEDVIQVGCMAHARRKFAEAIKSLPKGADISKTKTNEGINYFTKLYKLEKEYKQLSINERYILRGKNTKPLIEEFHDWLLEEKEKTLPKSPLGKAIKYTLNQWNKLINFLEDGRIEIDNNRAERAIKPFVIGRKNWMFSKSPNGAIASAICYSVIETAKANNLKPFYYLEYLFEKLPNLDLENPSELDAILPWSKTIPNNIRL